MPRSDGESPPFQSSTGESVVEIPSFSIDAAHVVSTPFTIHLQLGTTAPNGVVVPRLHLALGSTFARHLQEKLAEAVEQADGEPAPAEKP